MKKTIVFMLSVLMSFCLAACGSQDSGSSTSTPQSANEGSGTETVQNPSGQQQEGKEVSAEASFWTGSLMILFLSDILKWSMVLIVYCVHRIQKRTRKGTVCTKDSRNVYIVVVKLLNW